MKETPSQKNLFTGSLDLDSEARSVKENDYIDALNIHPWSFLNLFFSIFMISI